MPAALSPRRVVPVVAIPIAAAVLRGSWLPADAPTRPPAGIVWHDEGARAVALGQLLPPGTLVDGKLANGMAIQNQIRPVFVGRGFGNYDDRLMRDDVRYILTYDLPLEGFESQPGLIAEILGRYPNRQHVATFEVDETPAIDRAVLVGKRPGPSPAAASGSHRARD